MPITLPAFQPFQGAAGQVPLKGNWNRPPLEGDRFISAEIDWITNTGGLNAVQFTVGGNSPVALSQVVSLYVDNSRCGSDVQFVFPDTGFAPVVPAHDIVLLPVLTNALTFYAVAATSTGGDITILQILNSYPPGLAVPIKVALSTQASTALTLTNSQTLQLIPAGISGSINAIAINGQLVGDAAGNSAAVLNLTDGSSLVRFSQDWNAPANALVPVSINLTGISQRFINGLSIVTAIVVGQGFINTGAIAVNVYYTTP
jgi:hypothetical protein